MRILMISSEASPYARTGGLGEVTSALPAELVGLGASVDVVMPKYGSITQEAYPKLKDTGLKIDVTLNDKPVHANVWTLMDERGVRFFFLECDEYYDRPFLYGTKERDYEDNAERFVFLCRGAIEMALRQGAKYDVYHAHDWQSALTPVYLRTLYAGESQLQRSAALMTIHNLGHQGIFWYLDMPLVGVGWEFFTPKHMEFHGKLNFLKSGIIFADEVNTVSPGYADEILTPEFGFGLEGVLQDKGSRLTGILNGVDYSVWNPALDNRIAANYTPEDLGGKAICKADLQKRAKLPLKPDAPLFAVVSRLANQKGIDLIGAIMPSLMQRNVQLVLLGTGDRKLEEMFRAFAEKYPDKAAVFFDYDDKLAHQMFAGCDILLAPSRYEPCGLNQLYALKYGTVPVVRLTGGLIDTVDEFDLQKNTGTGFRFAAADPAALEGAIGKALDTYVRHQDAWRRLMLRGMSRDFSWKRSAREYLKLYEKAIADRDVVWK